MDSLRMLFNFVEIPFSIGALAVFGFEHPAIIKAVTNTHKDKCCFMIQCFSKVQKNIESKTAPPEVYIVKYRLFIKIVACTYFHRIMR